MNRSPELTPAQCVAYAALVVLVTLIITLFSLWLAPGDFGARLYGFAQIAVFASFVWVASRNIRRHWRD
ncbi:MAG TPA: hypothetical protein PK530_13280 [Anaerolineales bacterium]|nr:hypothetical protein [Anaerolineales bacterium]